MDFLQNLLITHDVAMLALLCLLGFISAYLGGFSTGGASSLGVGLLTLIGLSPQLATITYKLGKIGDTLGGIYLFYKNGHIPKRFLLGWGIAMFSGSFLGSYFIFQVSDAAIYIVSGISMLLLTGISVVKKIEVTPIPVSRRLEFMLYATQLGLSSLGNMFMAGSGAWYFFAYTFFLRIPPLQIKGMSAVFGVCWYVGTFFWVLAQGMYNIPWAIAFGIWMFIGWYFSTHHIIRMGNEFLRKTLLGSIALLACYFLYRGMVSVF